MAEDLDVAPVAGALRHPLLSAEHERDLARRAADGDGAARERLVAHNYRLVAKLARRYAGSGVPLPDLFQEGVCDLLLAAEGYDPEAGTRFATYATWWIRSALQRAIRIYQPVVLSQPAEDRRRKVAGALGAMHGASDPATVAACTGLSRDDTRRALALHALQQPLRIDAAEVAFEDRTALAVEEQVAHALRRIGAERLIGDRREQSLRDAC